MSVQMTKKIFGLGLVLALVFFSKVGLTDERTERIRPMIKEYVQQAVLNEMISTVGEIYSRILKQNDLNILPQVVYEVTQQTVLQMMNQDDLRTYIVDAFEQALDEAMVNVEEGIDQEEIQRQIKAKIDEVIGPVREDRHFKFLLEEMLKKGYAKSQQIMMKVAVGQYAAQAAVRQAVMQQAIMEQYKLMIENMIQQTFQAQQQYQQKVLENQELLRRQYEAEQQFLRQQQLGR